MPIGSRGEGQRGRCESKGQRSLRPSQHAREGFSSKLGSVDSPEVARQLCGVVVCRLSSLSSQARVMYIKPTSTEVYLRRGQQRHGLLINIH